MTQFETTPLSVPLTLLFFCFPTALLQCAKLRGFKLKGTTCKQQQQRHQERHQGLQNPYIWC